MKIFIALLAFQVSVSAQLIQSFTGGNDLNLGPGTAGFDFTVGSQPLSISALGVWISADTGLLTASHSVGLWDAQHNLIASTTVTPSAIVQNGFAWANLSTSVTLLASGTYTLAAQYADVDFDQALGNLTSVTMNGSKLGDALLSSGTGFSYPDVNVSGANLGFIGPNAAFAPVPEVACWSLVSGLCLLAFAAVRRWRIT